MMTSLLILLGCSKAEVTEVKNFYNEYGIDFYEIDASIKTIKFDNGGGQWSFNNQIALLELGHLDSGDFW
ncbi:MAG: hypothetical protein WBG42_05965 [Cryomorphaceae bacterium]